MLIRNKLENIQALVTQKMSQNDKKKKKPLLYYYTDVILWNSVLENAFFEQKLSVLNVILAH